jgi:signal transduction histidine kinase
MVHSFGSATPPFTTHSTAFESTIKRELGAEVDLDQVSLENARYADPDVEQAFAEFLAKRMAKWQPDLVVPAGAPAGRFVAKYRDKLFPGTPVLYSWVDIRTLPANAITNNATLVGQDFHLNELVEDMLQLDPELNHVVVILGATPLERYWSAEFQKAFEPFAGRLKFTYVNDLSFEQILDLVSTLPPHSFVQLGLLVRDASGVTFNQDDVLRRLNAVSRAPVNGMFQYQVGRGIVGGRLFQDELTGAETARVAARILRGEPASGFPPLVIPAGAPTYDWRELRRWQISESRLPVGSVVLFRQPTVWEKYRWHVTVVLAIIIAQAMLILALLFHRQRNLAELARKRAQAEVQQKRAELEHVARVVTLGELTGTLAHEINQPLSAILSNSSAGIFFLDAPEPDFREVRAALSDISRDSARAADVIHRLRHLLKRDTLEFVNLDLNDVIRTVERIVHMDAILHGVAVDLDLSPGVVPVKGDSVQLQQVMLNLMLNAFTAMSEPQLNGARRLIVRTTLNDGSNVLVEVRDSGIGIAPDKLESIFDPFITTKRDGLGMGLSICRSIIETHGGKVWAANNPDRGATFSIVLPITRG